MDLSELTDADWRRLLEAVFGAATQAPPLAHHGEIGNGRADESRGDQITSTERGTSQTYLLRRLVRDAPEVLERVKAVSEIPHQPTTGQKAVVALKVRELLQPAAKERQREAGEQFGKGAKVSPDLGEAMPAPVPAPVKISLRAAAERFGVPESTLRRKTAGAPNGAVAVEDQKLEGRKGKDGRTCKPPAAPAEIAKAWARVSRARGCSSLFRVEKSLLSSSSSAAIRPARSWRCWPGLT